MSTKLYYEMVDESVKIAYKEDFRKLICDTFKSQVKSDETALEDLKQSMKDIGSDNTVISQGFGSGSKLSFILESDRILFMTSKDTPKKPGFLVPITEAEYLDAIGGD